jgi:hypothetical protein
MVALSLFALTAEERGIGAQWCPIGSTISRDVSRCLRAAARSAELAFGGRDPSMMGRDA